MRYYLPLLLALLTATLTHAQPAAPAAGPACHGCSFSDGIDARIRAAAQAAGADSSQPEELLRLLPPRPAAGNQDQGYVRSKAGAWSAWSRSYQWLSWCLHQPEAGKAPQPYEKPLRLPTSTGRLLYLSSPGGFSSPTLLVEFEAEQFRVIVLTTDLAGRVQHTYHRHPDAELLVLTHTDGYQAPGSFAYTTWLSVLDLRLDQWLLDTVVEAGRRFTYDDDQYAGRHYQVQDAGRTLVLGRYRATGQGKYQSASLPPLEDRPQMRHDLPPGTYRLRAGRYQPTPSAAASPAPGSSALPPTTTAGRSATGARRGAAATAYAAPAPRRAAVGAAEVNGTFRDARGREFRLLALGGGRVRLYYQGEAVNRDGTLGGAFVRGEARIQADSAVLVRRVTPRPCAFYLRFVRPGWLQVRQTGDGCGDDAAGLYPKVSAAKPDFQ